ncbi:Short-chain dehydrogenase/reductase ATR10 [Pseudocercospora fuligena]|uniref:Short-chain dehydrogenase/reductase ATR10 n=1 Tax=Pseudocercospora fuligena TaxID=685502 RepID=A0A8H6RC65_9PEZI|nr:Short-chain dehydrogenase/reductase ATR10 [Pseudocercospora fuligena]
MAANHKEIVLITGGNTGLGFEIAKKLLREHKNRFHILIGARTPSKGEAAVKDLQSQGYSDVEFFPIEVTNNASIAAAAKTVNKKFGRLDILHVNAGIAPDKDKLSKVPISDLLMETFHTNAAGAAQTAEEFIPLLQKAENPRIIFMSTGLGSLDRATKMPAGVKNWPAYASSKAALNMIML